MKTNLVFLALILASTAQANAACLVSKSWHWQKGLEISANSSGTTCLTAEIDVSISLKKKIVWKKHFKASDQMSGGAAANEVILGEDLALWFAPMPPKLDTSKKPAWPKDVIGKEIALPKGSEFPFIVAPHLTQATYTAIRAAKAPLYCFVDGMEHQHCIYFASGKFEALGDQRFPG